MNKALSISAVLLFTAACSEPVTPAASLDLSPTYAKGGSGGGGGGPTGGPTIVLFQDIYDFTSGSIDEGTSSFATEIQAGTIATASDPAIVEAPSGQLFLGRFFETRTELHLVLPNGQSKYFLEFHLYTIGSWDGKGKQAQQGTFQANIVTLAYKCAGSATLTPIHSSTYSNQLTVQQDYPANTAIGQSGGNKAGTGSFVKDALLYKDRADLSNTPPFRSFGDISYLLQFAGNNHCGAGAAITFVWSTSNPTQQSLHDESWGIDNLTIKAGT